MRTFFSTLPSSLGRFFFSHLPDNLCEVLGLLYTTRLIIRDYFQNTPYVVLRNRPSLYSHGKAYMSISNDRGMQLGTAPTWIKPMVQGLNIWVWSPNRIFDGRTYRTVPLAHGRSWVWAPAPAGVHFFLHPPFLPPWGERVFFFRTFPTTPTGYCTKPLDLTNRNSQKSYKDHLQNTAHVVLRNHPSLSIAMERLTCLNNDRGVQLGILA